MRLVLFLVTFLPTAALACGGLFCNSRSPVTQAAERILFAPDGDQMHMHIRLTYAGPPAEFGWLLPAPSDVETALSSEAMFALMDRWLAPRFMLRSRFEGDCHFWDEDLDSVADSDGDGAEDGGGAAVLSREAVGPYDRVILRVESVQALRRWLDENEFQVPEGADAHLQPYVDLGMAFVALKLLPGAESRDVVPLRLTFTAPVAAIPMRPTAVAASPDMGVLVHVLGDTRAVPTNYAHVEINPVAIDWARRGDNYADVVSQAADEAGGRAFVTDYAGSDMTERLRLPVYDDGFIAQVRNARSPDAVFELFNRFRDANNRRVNALMDPDTRRVLGASMIVPEGITVDQVIENARRRDVLPGVVVDIGALVERLESEINAPRLALNAAFDAHPYLTRLFTTMSADEMIEDPIFEFNPDLEPVSNVHIATQIFICDEQGQAGRAALIETDDALFALEDGQNPHTIRRMDGLTVRGLGTRGAKTIERTFAAGQSEVIVDARDDLLPEAIIGATPCGNCTVGRGESSGWWWFGLLGLGLVRRRTV